MFESKECFQLFEGGVFNEKLMKADGGYLTNIAVNIKNRKPFDITKHELFKSGALTKHKNGRDLYVNHLMWSLDKNRAIAIAKALGVTGEDLK